MRVRKREPIAVGGSGWGALEIGLAVVSWMVFAGPAAGLSEPGAIDRLPATSPEPVAGLQWRRSDRFGVRGEGGVVAVALHGGWLAVAGEDRVSVGRQQDGREARSFAVQGAQDLRFDADGGLLVATRRGLWSYAGPGSSALRDVSPGRGEEARRVHRIATGSDLVAVATDGGAFVGVVGERGIRWRRVDAEFPGGPVSDVALEGNTLWAIVGAALWRVEIEPGGATAKAREVALPERSHGQAPVQVVAGLPGHAVALVDPDSILLGRRDSVSQAHEWSVVRPVLPPGATMRRLGQWAEGYWLATDRGLLLSRSVAGPWRRAGSPAGSAMAYAATPIGERLYVASAGGLLVGQRPSGPALRAVPTRRAHVPSIRAVHRAALHHQGLEPRVVDEAWRGVRRRGWLPTVGLAFDADRDLARARERDEVFVSGDYHTLHDRDRDRSLDLGASLTLSWDLRDLAFEPEQIDLSREARLVIGLRDDVLDEVNQLYFERLSIQGQLRAASRGDELQTLSPGMLQLRLHELTAGLDAWTGGWFSEQLERALPTPD